jgi:uncharacterized protein (TIGR02118 family)
VHKLVVLYYRVDDETALEEFFSGVHLPLVERLPGLRALEIGRVQGQPLGQSRFTLTVEATFDSRAALEAALTTETGLALMNALRPWAENRLIAWYYADTFREEH